MGKLSQHTRTVLGIVAPAANAVAADAFSPDGGACTPWVCGSQFDGIEFELISGAGWAGEQPNVWVEYANLNPRDPAFALANVVKGKLYDYVVTQRPDTVDPLLPPVTSCELVDTDETTRDFLLPGTENSVVETDWCTSDLADGYNYVRLCYDPATAAAAPLAVNVQLHGLAHKGCKCCPSVFPPVIA